MVNVILYAFVITHIFRPAFDFKLQTWLHVVKVTPSGAEPLFSSLADFSNIITIPRQYLLVTAHQNSYLVNSMQTEKTMKFTNEPWGEEVSCVFRCCILTLAFGHPQIFYSMYQRVDMGQKCADAGHTILSTSCNIRFLSAFYFIF